MNDDAHSVQRPDKIVAILAAFIGLASGYASSQGATATTFILPLTHEFGWGRIVPALMYVSSMAGVALGSIWLGRAIERFGAPPIALVSGCCLAITLVLLGLQNGSPALALAVCFLAGFLGCGTTVGLYLAALPRWFDRDLGRALGLSIIGMSAGVTLMPALASAMINAHGWRTAYFSLAAVQLLLTGCAVILLFRLKRRAGRDDHPGNTSQQAGTAMREAMRTRRFWMLAAMTMLGTIAVFGTSFQIFPLYADRGADASIMPLVAISLGLGTLIGRLSSGVLLDYIDSRIVAVATFLLGGAGMIWLGVIDRIETPLSLYVPALLIGAALGSESDIVAFIARRYFGSRHYPAIYNRLLVAFYAGAVVGPLGFGWMFDRLQSSAVALFGAAACCLSAGLIALALPPSDSRGAGK